jgi:hypothetical protein
LSYSPKYGEVVHRKRMFCADIPFVKESSPIALDLFMIKVLEKFLYVESDDTAVAKLSD